jgi:(E)-4-hydroxy-3-methylbut-2-enyl-diphosphate synthase
VEPVRHWEVESHRPFLCCQVFAPLVEKCKKYGRALRIGTNHGSLSDRIMSYYGDSPRGMVESAFEFANICRKLDFHNFLFSMKASNPVVMVQAYRLLVSEMYLKGWDYPLHLGVTEAGEGEDGRMKSAIGIGALLQDGLGDTIRVSLTEEPEHEIDPCTKLANLGMKITKEQKGVVSPSLALDIFQLNIVLCTGQTLALYDLFWS